MNTFQIEQMIVVARQYKLALHAHTDLEGMQILLKKAKGLVGIWAHGGGDVDEKYLQNFWMNILTFILSYLFVNACLMMMKN